MVERTGFELSTLTSPSHRKIVREFSQIFKKEESSGAGEIFIARSSLRFLSHEVLRRLRR
jgi:hypothetical protein